jgi:hypothetical protein
MKHTGVNVTAEELAELRSLANTAGNTPVMAVSVGAGLAGRDLASWAKERCKKRCHELALAHGLPEIPGYYGVTGNGEFVSF